MCFDETTLLRLEAGPFFFFFLRIATSLPERIAGHFGAFHHTTMRRAASSARSLSEGTKVALGA